MPMDKLNMSSLKSCGACQAALTLSFATAVLLWAVWCARMPNYDPDQVSSKRYDALTHRVDPNSDAWWKIAALPGIGMIKAKRIVAFRSRVQGPSPFVRPQDLQQIRGIGPKTVARITPLLRLKMDGTKQQQARAR